MSTDYNETQNRKEPFEESIFLPTLSPSQKFQRKARKKENARKVFEKERNRIKLLGIWEETPSRKSEKETSKALLFALGAGVILTVFLTLFGVLMIVFGAGVTALGAGTFPSADADIIAVNETYSAWEAALLRKAVSFEKEGSYEEILYDLDETGHDPYVLTSLLSAAFGSEYTLESSLEFLKDVFDAQYELSYEVRREPKTHTVTKYLLEYTVDPDTGKEKAVYTPKAVTETYESRTLTVTLRNNGLSTLPAVFLSEDALGKYALYLSTLGNRPDLFPLSEYVGKYEKKDPDYTISPEALKDPQFAREMEEAQKYLGYPYVFGGSSPKTSFDCSGYVSWILSHSGYDLGRLGATALYNLTSPVAPGDLRPGDLVFFKGTYKTISPDACSHVGIYVGDGWMLDAGDPIGFHNLNTPYYQNHFFAFGRMPPP